VVKAYEELKVEPAKQIFMDILNENKEFFPKFNLKL